jgi:hypothetical protein
MRLTRECFQHYGADYEKRREQFQPFIAAMRQLIESTRIPSLSIIHENPEELRIQYIGRCYAIRYQYAIGQENHAPPSPNRCAGSASSHHYPRN